MADLAFIRYLGRVLRAKWILMLRAFIDESNTHGASKYVVVGGFLFSESAAVRFVEQWNTEVAHRMPPGVVFHTLDCIGGRGDFQGMRARARELIIWNATTVAKDNCECAVAVVIDRKAYQTLAANVRAKIGHEYTLAALQVIRLMANRLRAKAIEGDVTYVFEKGASHQGELSQRLAKLPTHDPEYRMHSFSFVDKKDELLLACGDLIAHQWMRSIGTFLYNTKKPDAGRTMARMAFFGKFENDYIDKDHIMRLVRSSI